jgi:hypothetical protein
MMLSQSEQKPSQRLEIDENSRDGAAKLVAYGKNKRKYTVRKEQKNKTHRASVVVPKKLSTNHSYSKIFNSKKYDRSVKNF